MQYECKDLCSSFFPSFFFDGLYEYFAMYLSSEISITLYLMTILGKSKLLIKSKSIETREHTQDYLQY